MKKSLVIMSTVGLVSLAACSSSSGSASNDQSVACIGNVSIDFASLTPDWLDTSTACGTATAASGSLDLTFDGTCDANSEGGIVTLDAKAGQLCGDFDVQVDLNLETFSIPTAGSRWAAFRAYDPAGMDGISIERYDVAQLGCRASTQNYKGWSTSANASECGPGTRFVATTDATPRLRLTRSGSTVTSYYSDDGGGSWQPDVSESGATTTPWSLIIYTGKTQASADTASQSVSFSNLSIVSASRP